jgi:hypothetical protein
MTDEDLKTLDSYAAAHAKNDGVTARVFRKEDDWFAVETINTSGGAPPRRIGHNFKFVDLEQAQRMVDRVMEEARRS